MKTCLDCKYAQDYPSQPNKVCVRNPPVGVVIPATMMEPAKVIPFYSPIPLVPCGEFRDRNLATGTVVPIAQRDPGDER